MSIESAVHWTSAPLGSLGQIRLGKMLDKAKNTGSMVQYLRNVNVRWFQFDLSDMKSLRLSDAEQEMFSVRDGDVFICEGGEPGRCAVWHGGTNLIVYQKALHRFRTSGAIAPRFLMYQLRHQAYSGALQKAFSGTTIKHLTRESLSRHDVTLPPAQEQQLIAAKLDAVLARVDACRERLDCLPGILKRFRSSVLATATSGRLTEDWRISRGFSEPIKTTLGAVVRVLSGGFLPAKDMTSGGTVPVFGGNGINGYHDQGNVTKETVVLGRVGFYCGSVHMTPSTAWVTDNAMIVRHDEAQISRRFLYYALQAIDLRANDASTAQPLISGQKIYPLVIVVPTVQEQAEIVRRVDSLFAWADRLEARQAAVRAQVDRLTPSLLAKAFRGELVPQDPADESASELLKRLSQQPSANPTAPAKRQEPKPHRAKASQTASNVREESSS